jgi:uncharacterized protein involved in response to NO
MAGPGLLAVQRGRTLAFVSGLADTPRASLAVLFFALFTLHSARLVLWHDRGLWHVPLLWSLHLAYA